MSGDYRPIVVLGMVVVFMAYKFRYLLMALAVVGLVFLGYSL